MALFFLGNIFNNEMRTYFEICFSTQKKNEKDNSIAACGLLQVCLAPINKSPVLFEHQGGGNHCDSRSILIAQDIKQRQLL